MTGKLRGTKLKLLPSTVTIWKAWKKLHPKTKVLSLNTGYDRDYSRNPYASYDLSQKLYFPVAKLDESYHPKTWTFGIRSGNKIKLYPFDEVLKIKTKGIIEFSDKIDGTLFLIRVDPAQRTITATNSAGVVQPIITGYWFALRAFYSRALVYHQS